MIYRTMKRLEKASSVVMFGGAKLGQATQEEADQSIAYAIEQGVNHFDMAASYGDSEIRLGPWMGRIREQIFLASKTGERTAVKAKEEIYRSLERLQVDHLDLIQLHAVGTIDELDLCTAKGGVLEAVLEAKAEGLVKAIGITGHGHEAPATHLEALKRFPFDTILTPYNYFLYSMPEYRLAFDRLAEETSRQSVSLRVIKAIAKGPWKDEQPREFTTWYEPFSEQKIIDACVHFVLFRQDITGFASAGDMSLFPKIVDAASRFGEMNEAEVHHILSQIPHYASPFGAPTSIA
ncbi:aldo/keto reductase [Paenibacillus psychroresistens]|uniref:Aldo/keto reductase n=1 Tax=Paenibacillus psychroresistens TaxID=1778678 RepID=A0A6B8REP8_9BACL|nr:aldo/keto reductase [Paenibacillus psychroresistens]QGQ94025.1 aldo/keto reductase [Paenibacillus psychroresistens]